MNGRGKKRLYNYKNIFNQFSDVGVAVFGGLWAWQNVFDQLIKNMKK